MTTGFDLPRETITKGPEGTEALGERVAAFLEGGEILALCGELGSGKTTFVRGLARGLGVKDPFAVKSPSYTLHLRYLGHPPLLHLDAYFMRSLEDVDLCGMEDALARREVVVVEWGERVEERLPKDAWVVRFEHVAPDLRRIRISWSGDAPESEKESHPEPTHPSTGQEGEDT